VRHAGSLLVVLLALGFGSPASAHPLRQYFALDRVNSQLRGRVLDFTHNHGADNRIWSPTLQQKRDLYVYLPPGFDACQQYPLIVYLHGHAQDEMTFLTDVIPPLDEAIAAGRMPPVIIVAPDGSLRGVDCFMTASSFFLNSEAGPFEDYLMVDVWNFAFGRFPLRPEREAHLFMGASLGGAAAFNKGIKYPDRIGAVLGLFPPLNLRWQDCRGRYMGNFDPDCWGWRTDFVHRRTVVARFYGIPVHLRSLISPLYSRRNPETLPAISSNNAIEMLDLYDVRPGQLEMYVAYGGRDQFNIDAQVESFLFVARHRGLEVGVGYEPKGKHDRPTAKKLLPGIIDWMAVHLAPYAPAPLFLPSPLWGRGE
jgi:S-formylglutathione hydrolase FrmB